MITFMLIFVKLFMILDEHICYSVFHSADVCGMPSAAGRFQNGYQAALPPGHVFQIIPGTINMVDFAPVFESYYVAS